MSHLPPHTFSLNAPAAEPSKEGAAASRVTVGQMRCVRIPKPLFLTEDDRLRAMLMIDAAPTPAFRALVVLVRIDGFTIADAAAIIDVPPRHAIEQLKAFERIANDKIKFHKKCENVGQVEHPAKTSAALSKVDRRRFGARTQTKRERLQK